MILKKNNNKKKRLILLVTAIIIIILIVLTLKTYLAANNSCDTLDSVATSVVVKYPRGGDYIGFNVNKQNVTFGTISPGATVKRSAFANYTKDATVLVWAEGDFPSWIIISPKKFEILPNHKKEVFFTLLVPFTAKERQYKGRIVFCYQDKSLWHKLLLVNQNVYK